MPGSHSVYVAAVLLEMQFGSEVHLDVCLYVVDAAEARRSPVVLVLDVGQHRATKVESRCSSDFARDTHSVAGIQGDYHGQH